jgi:hypothetical protein
LTSVDPQTYLTDVITRIVNGHPQNRIDELLPWAYASPIATRCNIARHGDLCGTDTPADNEKYAVRLNLRTPTSSHDDCRKKYK